MENDKLLKKNLTIFQDVTKIEIYFPFHLFSYFFIRIEGFFEWKNLNIAIGAFEQTSVTCR